MPWVKLDDGFTDHPKIASLSDSAFRTFVTALCYCNKNLTDGFVPALIARQISTPRGLKELCSVGMIERDGKDFRVHDYTEYQPKREDVIAKREASNDRVARYRERHSGNAVGNAVTNAVSNAVGTRAPVPDPVPDPVPMRKTNPLSEQGRQNVTPTEPEGEGAVRDGGSAESPAKSVSLALWDAYTDLTTELHVPVWAEQQIEHWVSLGCTLEQVESALRIVAVERPDKPWGYFKTVLGQQLVALKKPASKPVVTLTAEQVQALRERAR